MRQHDLAHAAAPALHAAPYPGSYATPRDTPRDEAGSVAGASGITGLTGRSAGVLAESVYDGVRQRISRLTEDVKQRDASIVALHKVRCPARCDCIMP